MNSGIHHLDPLPENMVGLSTFQRTWNGVCLDVTEFRCAGRVVHQLSNDGDARLSVVVEEAGSSPCEPRLHKDKPCPIAYVPGHMLYAPAGLEIWGFSADTRYVKDATLTFDMSVLSERLAAPLIPAAVNTPQLRLVDGRIRTLVRLLADAVKDPDPSMRLYGDGLTAAIAARLFMRTAEPKSAIASLAPWQLRRVIEHLESRLPRPVPLAELAALSGLSQWHFSRAFKASTGRAPYRWQLDARIRRAQSLLLDTRSSLEQIAEATGFADAVHFGKAFRRATGVTPAVWRKTRRD